LPPEPQGPAPIIDPLTGDYTLEEKIRRLKNKLDEKPPPVPEETEKLSLKSKENNKRGSQKSI
jgi:hypothetical protein